MRHVTCQEIVEACDLANLKQCFFFYLLPILSESSFGGSSRVEKRNKPRLSTFLSTRDDNTRVCLAVHRASELFWIKKVWI